MLTSQAILEAFLLVTALSTDAFVSGFSYGASKIKIPLPSALVIAFICSGTLALALFFGGFLGNYIPETITTSICLLLLFALGLTKLFDSGVKALIRRQEKLTKHIHFSFFRLRFILKIYADPEVADRDHSRILSPSEAMLLALALSLDGLAVGFSAGISQSSPYLILAFSLIYDLFAISLGAKLGQKFSKRSRLDLSWLGGVLLLVLALHKLPR